LARCEGCNLRPHKSGEGTGHDSMKAAVYYGNHDLRIEEIDDPQPGPGEVVLSVHATGICGTDAAEYSVGPMLFPITQPHPFSGHVGPMVPGHEIAGTVAALGADVAGLRSGQLVVTGAGVWCGQCSWCLAGRTSLCAKYFTLGLQRNGGLAEYCAVPAFTCLPIADGALRGDTAALAQPMSIAVHSMRQGRPEPGQQALVIGAGGVGAFLTYALASVGAEVSVADLSPERLAIAARLGASQTIMPTNPADLLEELRARSVAPTVVFEVTGTAGGLSTALAIVARGGRVVAVGLHESPRQIDVRLLTLREVELIGTNAHVFGFDLPTAVELLATRSDPWTDVASVAFGLDRLVPDGLVPLVEGRASQIKTLIDPWIEGSRPTEHRR
jgi:(R,R)-butanediol dehydrogenase/meso-butanediol dehydrogenase/diacetyl reductase